jgi:hypothetical protein
MERNLLGIFNFGDVVSNLPLAAIGLWGLVFLLRSRFNMKDGPFLDGREAWPYVFAFGGFLLTAFGSSFYHLTPDNARLVWDRLPMTVTFMVDGSGSDRRAHQPSAWTLAAASSITRRVRKRAAVGAKREAQGICVSM